MTTEDRAQLRPLRAAVAVVSVLAVDALLTGPRVGAVLGWAVFGLLVAVPMLRVAFLGWAWWRRGDRRFAGLAGLLIATLLVGWAVNAVVLAGG